MKKLVSILTLLLVSACGHPDKLDNGSELIKAAYVGYNHNGTMRTDYLNFDKIKQYDPLDTLVASTEFSLDGHEHLVNIWTSDLVAAMDGGAVYIELKNLGVIYYRSTSWNSYRRLKTNNDSINYIIDTAIDNVVLNFTLDYQPGQLTKKQIDLKTPKVGD
jgi:hypothetical protein